MKDTSLTKPPPLRHSDGFHDASKNPIPSRTCITLHYNTTSTTTAEYVAIALDSNFEFIHPSTQQRSNREDRERAKSERLSSHGLSRRSPSFLSSPPRLLLHPFFLSLSLSFFLSLSSLFSPFSPFTSDPDSYSDKSK